MVIRRPPGCHFLFGLCVRADAAAVFAAALDFGLLRTFDAADAARELVTSLLDLAMVSYSVWHFD